MKVIIVILCILPFSIIGMQKSNLSANSLAPEISYSTIQYSKNDNDYTIHATLDDKQIGHVTYGPTKNPQVPHGTWAIKSIRVAPEYLKQKIGYNLFSKAIADIIKRKEASHISINAVPRLESPMASETLVNIYLKMIEKINPQLRKTTTVRPWPSDPDYKQLLIKLT